MSMIDSHCHLADPQFAEDLEAVIERARKAGITQMVTIADSFAEAETCIKIAEAHPQIFATVGVHPHNAKEWERGDGERVRSLVARSKKVKAIGEIGLDYHYDNSPRGTQRAVFLEQLTLAKDLLLPSVVHCRDAIDDVRTIINDVEPHWLVLHCCTEKWEDVEALVARGHFLSFTGIATYPKSTDIRETIKQCPLERMMIETDAPYLAPIPHRGKRNEPAYVREVAAAIAEIKGISLEEVDTVTAQNAVAFFGLPS